jgi:hypothetical protein
LQEQVHRNLKQKFFAVPCRAQSYLVTIIQFPYWIHEDSVRSIVFPTILHEDSKLSAMTLVQDNHLACHSLSSLESKTLQNIVLKSINNGESSSTDARGAQEHSRARQTLLETIRGAPNAPVTGGKTPFLVILTADQARMIYSLRSESTAKNFELRSVAGKSSLVAELYGVSPKTIRDVWNRKTWTQVVTIHPISLLIAVRRFRVLQISCTYLSLLVDSNIAVYHNSLRFRPNRR